MEVVNHCTLTFAGLPLGVLFRIHVPATRDLDAHDFYKVVLIRPLSSANGTHVEALAALNRQGLMIHLLRLLAGHQAPTGAAAGAAAGA